MSTTKDEQTRRSVMIRAAVGAAAAAAVGTQAKAQMATPRIIRAVAVGRTGADVTVTITTDTDIPATARPYIKGLVEWLGLAATAKTKPKVNDVGQYVLGTGAAANNYTIEYRERPVDTLGSAFEGASRESGHLLFCMSTSVGDAAVDYMEDNDLTVPMVVISSNRDNFEQDHVCVVSARRPQLIRACLRKFKQLTGVATVHALHRQDHAPSTEALRGLKGAKVEPVRDDQNPATVVSNIDTSAGTHGLLVLPADRFFAAANDIVTSATANHMQTYWTTPDWPTGSYGAYGYEQRLCGRYMAERVGRIWDRDGPPPYDKKDVKIPASEITKKP